MKMKKRFLSFWVIVSLFAINTFAGEVSKPFERGLYYGKEQFENHHRYSTVYI
jgi:hypothetical protein